MFDRCIALLTSIAVSTTMLMVAALAQDYTGHDARLVPLLQELDALKAAGDTAGLARRAPELIEQAKAVYGPDNPMVASLMARFVDALIQAGRLEDTEDTLLATYAKIRSSSPVGSPDRQEIVEALGHLYRAGSRIVEAELLRESERRDKNNAQYALMHIPEFYRQRKSDGDAFDLTFGFAQAPSSEASFALARMIVRRASGSQQAAALLRERQDLFGEWRKIEGRRSRSVKNGIADRVAKIDTELAVLLPAQTKEAAQKGLSLDEFLTGDAEMKRSNLQQVLNDNEAMLLFAHFFRGPADNREEYLFLWAVTKTEQTWLRVELSGEKLADTVDALRCGLDEASWTAGRRASHCASLLGVDPTGAPPRPLPFDHARAFKLHEALFGQVKNLIEGKRLLIVPSGDLTRLPFEVLISHPPAFSPQDNKTAHWFVRDHAIVLLPSVVVLQGLRNTRNRLTRARLPMIAFANPMVTGDERGLSPNELVKLRTRRAAADYRQSCDLPDSSEEKQLALAASLSVFLGSQTADNVRLLDPIPRTGTLACDVAKDAEFAGSTVLLAANATETKLRALDESGELGRYRIVHFATHGAMAGDVVGADEPGLILTPSGEGANSNDDGYFTASEIAELNLDADWVILSACNTAAASEKGGEMFSGVARAFFYAGARTLLVSHWSVNELAAVKLVAGAVKHQESGKVGRADAMRKAILGILDAGSARETHPSFWAPFVVVGEGATSSQ